MAILKKNAFSRRVPDLVTEELVAVLSRRASYEFKELFDIVHENLRARNAASGGEEMLRLRAYEKTPEPGRTRRGEKEWQEIQGPPLIAGQGDCAPERTYSGSETGHGKITTKTRP